MAGKVLHPDIQRYREPKNYFVTLNRGNVVFAVGILLTNSAVMTAAHSIHNLPQPGYGGVFFKAELYSTRYILNIDYVIYDSYKNSNLRERGIDFAVLHVSNSTQGRREGPPGWKFFFRKNNKLQYFQEKTFFNFYSSLTFIL